MARDSEIYWDDFYSGFSVHGGGPVCTNPVSAPKFGIKSILESIEEMRQAVRTAKPLVGAIVTDLAGQAKIITMCDRKEREAGPAGLPYLGSTMGIASIPIHRKETAEEAEKLAAEMSKRMRVLLFLNGTIRDLGGVETRC